MTTTDELKAQITRVENLLLSNHHLINYWSSRIMTDLTQLQAQVAELTAAAENDRLAALASSAKVEQAVGLLQALSASIAALQAQLAAAVNDPAVQSAVDALVAQVSEAVSDLRASATTEAAADAALDAAVAANTPAAPQA